MTNSTIAQQALNSNDYYAFAEASSTDVDQNWSEETTTYTFEDGSQLVCSGFEVEAV